MSNKITRSSTTQGWFLSLPDLPILGTVTIFSSPAGLTRLEFNATGAIPGPLTGELPALLLDARDQLLAYLDGNLTEFSLPIDWTGMKEFQRRVLQLCYAIPSGQTRTYSDLTSSLGYPQASARAVGTALARNPIPVIIPCHRVVGKDGKLHGYSGPRGIETKAALLQLEGARILA